MGVECTELTYRQPRDVPPKPKQQILTLFKRIKGLSQIIAQGLTREADLFYKAETGHGSTSLNSHR